MARNELELLFTSNDNEKEFKSKANQYVCALLNSNGGTLILNTEMEADKIIRSIEQSFQNIITTWGVSKKLSISSQTSNQITLEVKGYEELCTMNYNLYMPTDRQVMLVRPHEVSTVKHILNIHRIVDITETNKNVPTEFILNRSIGIEESKTVQFKYLKSGKSGITDLATRLENNKLTHYVSAFANDCGGRLYCGVHDNGTVEGQKVMDDEKEDFIIKVSQYINKMIWPEFCVEPQRGRPDCQWDISFEPVMTKADGEGDPIPSTFVIVIYVAACQGGVFCNEPESYHIIDGEVKGMKFKEWKRKFNSMERQTKIMSPKTTLAQCDWSSLVLKKKCDELDGELLRMINDGEWAPLDEIFTEIQKDTVTSSGLAKFLVLLSKSFVVHYRKGQYKEAEECLAKFDRRLVKADDFMIFQARRNLILSAMERSRGNHQKSYEIARDSLSKVEQLAPCILTVEYYVHFATMLTIIEGNKELKDLLKDDLTKDASFKSEAIEFYFRALDHLEEADYVPESKVDMGQKTYINLALLKLGCSLSGNVVDSSVGEEDIKAAGEFLKKASELEIDCGSCMNDFRSCHLNFAKGSLSYRRSQGESSVKRRNTMLRSAIKQAEEAEERATGRQFVELLSYAKQHAQVFKNELDKLPKD